VKLEAWAVGITAGSREVPGRNACDRRHTYRKIIIIIIIIIIIKVKWFRYRPVVAQRVGRGTALLFHDRGTRRWWVVSSTPRPYFTPGKDPVPISQQAGSAPGPVWKDGKSRPHRDSIPDRPVCSSVAIPTELPGPIIHAKQKLKWSRYRPGVAQRVGRGIALLFHDCGTRRGWVVSRTPRPHLTPGKDPVPILQEAKIIIIIIIIINCCWVVTRWQWLFYMYTKYEIGY